jgi:hypothetical protein
MSFVWITGNSPYFIDKIGNKIILNVKNNVPFFIDKTGKDCHVTVMPATHEHNVRSVSTNLRGLISQNNNHKLNRRTDAECMEEYEQHKHDDHKKQVQETVSKYESSLVSNDYNGYVHECLHMFGGSRCSKCKICNVAKQRRHKAFRVKEDDKEYATVFGEKTSFDTFEVGRNKLSIGIGNKHYALAVVDEASGWATFCPNKNKDHTATADGLLEHFGNNLSKAKQFYCDGYTAFKRVAKLLRIPTKYSTPNTPTSNSRQES